MCFHRFVEFHGVDLDCELFVAMLVCDCLLGVMPITLNWFTCVFAF